jgi:hypothetical protein
MSFTLTTDELKVASCGSIDYSKFTDSTKGYANIEDNSYKYFAFIAQDVLDAGFTEEEGKTIIDSLISKNVLIVSINTPETITKLTKEDYDSWVQSCFVKTATIDGKWMFFLSPQFINDRANS